MCIYLVAYIESHICIPIRYGIVSQTHFSFCVRAHIKRKNESGSQDYQSDIWNSI